MATITTTTNATPFEYPGNRLVVKVIGYARHIALVKGSTANNYLFYKSTDGGATWALMTTIVRANITDIGSIWADNQGWLFWTYRTNETLSGVASDGVYARRIETGPSNKPDTGEVLLGQAANGGTPGAALSGLAIVSHWNASAGYHYIPVAVGTTRGGLQGLSIVAAQIDPGGTISDGRFRFSGTREWFYADTIGRVGVSMDKEHNGDGLNGSSPNLWITFGRNNLRLVKVPWSGDGWTGSSGSTLIRSSTGARDTMPAVWDGNRYLMCIPDPTTTDRVLVYERNRSNSSTTTRQTPSSHPTGVVRQATCAYDYPSGNFRVFAVGTSTAVLYVIDYIRATDSWGAWTAVSGSPAVQGVDNFGVKTNTNEDANYGPYYATGTPTLTLTYTPQSQSYPPNTPVIDAPSSGAAQDVAASLLLDWTFSDPDPADTQSKYAISRQIGAGTLAYWRASDSTWQPAEIQNTSSTTNVTFASGWASGSDAAYTFKVKVWDAASNASAYSTGVVVVPSVKVNPAITAPTAAQVLTTDHVTITWTAAEQTKYQIKLINTSPGTGQVYDSGLITDSATRSVVVPYAMINSAGWTLNLTTANNEGLLSTTQTVAFTTAFTAPATPTNVNSASPAAGYITVKITNPTPGGSQPTIANNEVWRRVVGSTAAIRVGVGVANNGSFNDIYAVSGIAYEYQVVAIGSNGTSAAGAWTA
jgi:hypothetical protein